MGLFEEVGKNKNLVYVDDNDHGREYFLMNCHSSK